MWERSPQPPLCYAGCSWEQYPHKILEGYTQTAQRLCYEKKQAKELCVADTTCGGITRDYNNCLGTQWTLRSGRVPVWNTTAQDTQDHIAYHYNHVTSNIESEVKQCSAAVSCVCGSTTCVDNQDVVAEPVGMATAYNHPNADPHGKALHSNPRELVPDWVVQPLRPA